MRTLADAARRPPLRASRTRYLPIAEHGLIGDLHTVALVGTDGTIGRGVASALSLAAEQEAKARGFDRLALTVGIDNEPAQALYPAPGFVDAGVPPKRMQGTIELRTGPIEVDDTLLTWEKRLAE